jgi:hypothetical protein
MGMTEKPAVLIDQKHHKPKIEDVITVLLNGDKQKAALNFAAFMRENKLTPRWNAYNSWKVTYKNKSVCFINLYENDGSWVIRFSQFTRDKWFVNYEDSIINAGLKVFILDNINKPLCQTKKCWTNRGKTILGKSFAAVCGCWPLWLKNFDGENLENAKRFVLVIKKFIADL